MENYAIHARAASCPPSHMDTRASEEIDGQGEECGLAILASVKKVTVGQLRIAVTE